MLFSFLPVCLRPFFSQSVKNSGCFHPPVCPVINSTAESPQQPDPSTFNVDVEAAKKWLNNGAQPTEVVGKILKAAGVEK